MDKCNQTTARASAWGFINQARSLLLQLRERGSNIGNLDGNVMNARPALLQKSSDR
jgi:hypothetical protein